MLKTLRTWLAALLGAVLGLALVVGTLQVLRTTGADHGGREPILVFVTLLLGPLAVAFGGAWGWRLSVGGRPPVADGPSSVLVIGCGNTLRRDDGVGYLVAETVARWNRPGVSSRAVHQLVPELAEPLSEAAHAIFVDARPAHVEDDVDVRPIEPDAGATSALGHFGDPRLLLALAATLYGRSPPAWLVTVPAVDFELGEDLSPTARRGVDQALRAVAELMERDEG